MKYGESTFDILYLLFAILSGVVMLVRAKGSVGRTMGLASLLLGLGDAFHLVPRVMNYFSQADLTAALGIGKLVTSITMTVFYVLMVFIWMGLYHEKPRREVLLAAWLLFALRVVVCLLPENGWMTNSSDMLWGILRNIPFAALGVLVIVLYFRNRNKARRFRYVWLYVTLSFVFYLPVAVGAGAVPILGMLMLPKTVCYILLLLAFLLYVTKDGEKTHQNR